MLLSYFHPDIGLILSESEFQGCVIAQDVCQPARYPGRLRLWLNSLRPVRGIYECNRACLQQEVPSGTSCLFA